MARHMSAHDNRRLPTPPYGGPQQLTTNLEDTLRILKATVSGSDIFSPSSKEFYKSHVRYAIRFKFLRSNSFGDPIRSCKFFLIAKQTDGLNGFRTQASGKRERDKKKSLALNRNATQADNKEVNTYTSPQCTRKNIIIPHPTLSTYYALSNDDDIDIRQQRWSKSTATRTKTIPIATGVVGVLGGGNLAFGDRNGAITATIIEGGSGTGDTSIGSSDLKIAITAQHTDTECNNDSGSNRGGGGGVSVSCGGQSPPTPTVGKTLLNTSANLLPITTASDTFNNLKNLVKIDNKGSALPGSGNGDSGSYRSKGGSNGGGGGYKSGGGERSPYGNGRTGASGASGHFSTSYSKNSVKIRQHDSEVSPRPRRSYQSDSSSSSRYFNKVSDILGKGGPPNSGSSSGGRSITGSEQTGGRGGLNATNERRGGSSYQTDGGSYNRNGLSSNPGNGGGSSSSSGNGNYRQQQQGARYENGGGNGNGQQRQYGNNNSNATGYSNNSNNNSSYNNNKSSYVSRGSNDGNINARPSYRDDYGNNSSSGNSYRERDYDDSTGGRPRYTSGSGGGSSSNTNSLERSSGNPGGARYKQSESGTNSSLSSTHLRQDNGYERAQNNRTPPIRGGGSGAGANVSSTTQAASVNSASSTQSSSSRGISPNAGSGAQRTTSSPTPPPPAAGRWVPPSLRPQHGLTQTEKNDAVFRKVRGILNKLTPEKFQELSDDLLKLDLNSNVILNGVILLIFDKALDEPKYSSMYAQLCKRLSEEAPSFEKDPDSLCTFLRLLIGVCRNKFNDRLKREHTLGANDNNNQFNKVHRPHAAGHDNDTDEEERRHLAKQRMLGNVKFIGELNKLDMLSTSVLHQCILELLEKKKKRTATAQEMCEDMECLAQLLKTCGKNLDSEQGKELMSRYFEKLERRSKSTDYPPRIRFMLKDVIELRANNWIPRKVATTEGPVPIKQIRTDDDTLMRSPFASRGRDMRNSERDQDSWMNRFHLNLQPGYNDMFGGLSVSGTSPMMSPFNGNNSNNRPYNNRDRNNQGNNYNNNRYNKHNNNENGSRGGGGGNRDDMRSHNQHGSGGMMGRNGGNNGGSQYDNGGNGGNGGQLLANKELAPRFKRNLMSTNQDAVENLQMRPAANSLLFKAASQNTKMPPMLPISTPLSGAANHDNKDRSLSSAQYPLLSTPTTQFTSPRLGTTPAAEYDAKLGAPQSASQQHGGGAEKGLKATASLPNFGGVAGGSEKLNGADYSEASSAAERKAAGNSGDLVTKQGSTEKIASAGKQQKKEKAFNKEEVLKRAQVYIKENFFYDEAEDEEEQMPLVAAPAVVETPQVEVSEVAKTEEGGAAVEETAKAEPIESKEEVKPEVASVGNLAEKQPTSFNKLLAGFLELKVPEKCMKDVFLNVVMEVLDKPEERFLDRMVLLLQALRKPCNIKPNVLIEMFKQVVNKMNEREALNPRITTHVANILSKAVAADAGGLIKLNDIAGYTDNGQHYPLLLLVLQQLHKTIGKTVLEEKYRTSEIDLLNNLPEADRNKARLAEILDDRQLAFLYPLLKVQAEMLKQLCADPNPAALYKWIKTNVDVKHYKEAGFISALMTVLVKYISQETSLTVGSDNKKLPDKVVTEKEESLLRRYSQILLSLLGGNTELQLVAIYALQVFCYNENFPKGMLCRWFKYLYEAEVIEEESFILWKEEISDKYPGKGTALFQVNTWLTWLQETESEDDED